MHACVHSIAIRDKPSLCFVSNTRTKFCILLIRYCYIDCKYRIYFYDIILKWSELLWRQVTHSSAIKIFWSRNLFAPTESHSVVASFHLSSTWKTFFVCIKFSKKYLPKTFFLKLKHFIWNQYRAKNSNFNRLVRFWQLLDSSALSGNYAVVCFL